MNEKHFHHSVPLPCSHANLNASLFSYSLLSSSYSCIQLQRSRSCMRVKSRRDFGDSRQLPGSPGQEELAPSRGKQPCSRHSESSPAAQSSLQHAIIHYHTHTLTNATFFFCIAATGPVPRVHRLIFSWVWPISYLALRGVRSQARWILL